MDVQANIAEPLRPAPPPPPTSHTRYTLSLRGHHIRLSSTLLSSHSPNYFTRTLMAPSSSQVLSNQVTPFELDRDPEVFDVVVNWMMGYEVFPLTEKGMGSAERKALMYLSKEARFLELPELEEEAEIALRGI